VLNIKEVILFSSTINVYSPVNEFHDQFVPRLLPGMAPERVGGIHKTAQTHLAYPCYGSYMVSFSQRF